jgi:hypothetical protein
MDQKLFHSGSSFTLPRRFAAVEQDLQNHFPTKAHYAALQQKVQARTLGTLLFESFTKIGESAATPYSHPVT